MKQNPILVHIGETEKKLRAALAELTRLRSLLATEGLTAKPDLLEKVKTGWRMVRGDGSATYVQDPNGTDPLPPGYDVTTRAPHVRREADESSEDELLTFQEWQERERARGEAA